MTNNDLNYTALDENGRDARYQDWMDICGTDTNASDGERVTSAKALEIAADMLHRMLGDDSANKWEERDVRLALGAIAGIRAQAGVFSADSRALGFRDGISATHQLDIWIYG